MASIPDVNDPTNTQETPRVPSGSVPSVRSVAPPATPSQKAHRTEKPSEPQHVYHAFDMKDYDEAAIGNTELVFNLKCDGQLGTFYDRNKTTRTPTLVELNVASTRSAIVLTLHSAIERLIILGKHMEPQDIPNTAQSVAQSLANGIMVMFYMKLRSTNYLDPRTITYFHNKPKVPVSFEIPSPYALAVSQLGQIKVSGLPTEAYFTPTVSQAAAANFCLPTGTIWSPVNYSRSVEYAKKIGLQFTTVDLSVKMGSTWWLYRQAQQQGVFSLQCPLPEENFTEATAILHTLFCVNDAGSYLNPIFELAPVGTDTYGTMLRNPPDRVDLSTFFAITDEDESVWKIT